MGKVPNEWKFAQVTFIPKSTKLSDNAYYCPVSLHSSVEQAVGTYPYLLWNIRHKSRALLKMVSSVLMTVDLESGAGDCAVFLRVKLWLHATLCG